MPIPTTEQRVDALTALSDRIYPVIDQVDERNGETRARRMVRLGMRVVAQTLEESYGAGTAGNVWHSFLVQEFQTAGLSMNDSEYDAFSQYRDRVEKLPTNIIIPPANLHLDELANKYADVERATWAHDQTFETDASHVMHLTGIALPYAAEYYPHLDLRKVALYILIHDIPEAYVGDTPSFGLSDEEIQNKTILEARAFQQLEEEYGSDYPKLVKVVHDYENLADDEAKYVKTFDKLDPGFTHFSNGGHQLIVKYGIRSQQEHLDSSLLTTNRMMAYSSSFSLVLEDREQMMHRIGLATWPESM
ncbi:MAG: hypothetical protein JWM00_676 [Candidatus Saccharibacteria bacterium]|nr:hypothetical protein [Candidatus Saccharibacteria bacterium]